MKTINHVSRLNRFAGFSLIFVSILLTIAALIFVSVLPGQEAGDSNQKALDNTRKLERVEEAMRSFMAANGRRPCPADGQYTENTKYFGVEAATPGICTGGTPSAPLGPDTSTTACNGSGCVIGGVIPTKTLGLPDEYQYDDYGRQFTYIVDVRATESVSAAIINNDAIIAAGHTTTHAPGCYNLQQSIKYPSASGAAGAPVPAITIENTTGTGSTVIDYTMVAYISHGASGYGAWPAQGSVTTLTSAQSVASRINSGSTDTDMQVNAGVDALGVDSTFTYSPANFNVKVQKGRIASTLPAGGADTGFDDLVWYRPDLKNTCCLGAACLPKGFIANGYPSGTGDIAGSTVTTGDINGDGIPDLIISAPQHSSGGQSYNGAVYVVFGTRLGFPDPLPLWTLNGTNGFEIDGVSTWDDIAAPTTGDLNGDGIADLIISSSEAPNTNRNGYTYVVFGKRGTWTTPQTLNVGYGNLIDGTKGIRFDGLHAIDVAVGLATGDVNGDGIPDLIFGAFYANNYAGAAYVVLGKDTSSTTFLPSTTVTTTSGSAAITPASYANIMVGEYLTSANIPAGTYIHDCNGGSATVGTVCTGTIDMSTSATATASGTAMTVATTPLAVGTGTFIDGTQGVRFDGMLSNDFAGAAVATGDINDDGYADLVIGASGAAGGTGYGYTYVVFGKKASVPMLASTTYNWTSGTSITPTGGYVGLMVGETVAGTNIPTGTTITNCNSSGTTGTPCTSGTVTLSATPSGASTLYVATTPLAVGTGTFVDGIQGVRFDSMLAGGNPGLSLATGDVNGDGIPDLIIGEWGPNSSSGYAWLVFGKRAGSATFLPSTTTTSSNGNSTSLSLTSYTGFQVGQTLTGSGIPIGTTISTCSAAANNACESTNIALSQAANVLSGTTVTIASMPLNVGSGTFIDGIQGVRFDGIASDWVGHSLATGDVNGDGYADVIIGAGGAIDYAGITYVVFGHTGTWPGDGVDSATGSYYFNLNGSLINGTQGFRLDGVTVDSHVGFALAAGDINGDGIADIIIGANGGNGYAGCVYTYFGHKTSPQYPWPNPNYSLGGL